MKRVWGHKWAVGIAALVLVLALGAVAWAATDDADVGQSYGGSATDERCFAEGALFGLGGGGQGFMGHGHGMMDPENLPEEFQQRMEERRQQMEERQQAFLDLVRERMTEEDREQLDNLLQEAEGQREALDQAREDLQGTAGEIRDLVGKYFPLGSEDSQDDSNTTSTTVTGTAQ
jgi:Spy/CpxP family protein refolding chaperone